jgi:hypothetical protein
MKEIEVINLHKSETFLKYKALRAAGFDTIATDKGLILVDNKAPKNDCFVDTFKNIDEILNVVSDYILKAGYKVVAA